MQLKINPKCFPFDDEGNVMISQMSQCMAFSASGYYLPCCWIDNAHDKYENPNGIYDEELNAKEGMTPEKVLKSKQWKDFYHTILFKPEKAGSRCKTQCGVVIDGDHQYHYSTYVSMLNKEKDNILQKERLLGIKKDGQA